MICTKGVSAFKIVSHNFGYQTQTPMNYKKMFVLLLPVFAVIGLIVFNACKNAPTTTSNADNAGLTVPASFSAIAIAEHLGNPRHMVITPENDLYVHLAGTKNAQRE